MLQYTPLNYKKLLNYRHKTIIEHLSG